MSNHTHGGPRSGAGRPRKEQKRINKSVTLLPRQIEALAALPGQTYQVIDLGLNIAIPAIQQAGGDEGRLCAQIAYQAIGEAITRLEILRDYSPAGVDGYGFYWTPEQAELHKLLNQYWAELRESPLFFETIQYPNKSGGAQGAD